MNYTITITNQITAVDIRSLLEDEWLVPRKVRHFLRTRKNVLLNDAPCYFHEAIVPGDNITLIFEKEDYVEPALSLGDKQLVDVLYEDDHLLIVNKPYGMKTHPNQPEETNTLQNHVAAYLHNQSLCPYVVHRLDKETSGAIIFAKNPFVLPILGRMLEAKEIRRVYQGKIQGYLASSTTITKKIGRDRHDRRKRIVDERSGQSAVTHVTVINSSSSESWVQCVLDTGRTHQIRVHLSSIGHPLLGDPLYHPQPEKEKRLMLHATSVFFHHPFTKEPIFVEATPSLFE